MVETKRRYDIHFGHSEVMCDVFVFGMCYDLRMPHGVGTIFVCPRVQGVDVDILDLFPVGFVHLVVQSGNIGAPSSSSSS